MGLTVPAGATLDARAGDGVRAAQTFVGFVVLVCLWIVAGFLAAGVWWLVTLGWGWWPL
jgi:hypothetical protein